jgi:hypothetical protein
MKVSLDVGKAVSELRRAADELEAGNSLLATINAESALARIVSHARQEEVVVHYVPDFKGAGEG